MIFSRPCFWGLAMAEANEKNEACTNWSLYFDCLPKFIVYELRGFLIKLELPEKRRSSYLAVECLLRNQLAQLGVAGDEAVQRQPGFVHSLGEERGIQLNEYFCPSLYQFSFQLL